MPVERTFVLLKPDAVQRGLTFEVSERFEKRGLTLAACRMQQPPQGTLEKHCEALKGSAGYDAYLAFLTAGPVVAQVWEGADAVAAAVATVGDADPVSAANGTIRGDLAVDPARNLVDCAASKAEAARSIALWFKPEELVSAAAPGPSAPAAPAKVSGAAKAMAAKVAAPAAPGAAAAGEEAGASTDGMSKRAAAKEAKKAEKAAAKAAHQAAAGAAKPGQKQTSGHTVAEHVEVGRAIETEPPSGTRDFFPEQMRLQNWLFGHFRATARRFAFQARRAHPAPAPAHLTPHPRPRPGCISRGRRTTRANPDPNRDAKPRPIPHQEYDAPVLESEELYKRKVRGRGRGVGRVTGSPTLTLTLTLARTLTRTRAVRRSRSRCTTSSTRTART